MKIKRFLLVTLVAVAIEFGVFNFSNITAILDHTRIKNRSYTLSDMTTNNWKTQNGILVSGKDPMLIIKNVNGDVKNISIKAQTNRSIPYIDVFYTNDVYANFDGKAMIEQKSPSETAQIDVNQKVKDLRIDLADDAGLELKSIQVTVNPVKLDFSVARVIAMLGIYYGAVGLFSLQQRPQYRLTDDEDKENKIGKNSEKS